MVDINSSFDFFIDKIYVKSKNENKDLTDYKLAKGKDLFLNYPEYFLQDFEKLYQYYEAKFPNFSFDPFLDPTVENKHFNHDFFRTIAIGFKNKTYKNNPKICDFETIEGKKIYSNIKQIKSNKLIRVLKSYKLLLGQAILEKGNFSETDILFFEDTLIKLEKGEVPVSFIKDGVQIQDTLSHFIRHYGEKSFYVNHCFYLPDVSHELLRNISKSYEASLTIKNVTYQFSFENSQELRKFHEQILESFIKELDQITEENTNVKKLEMKKVDSTSKKSYT